MISWSHLRNLCSLLQKFFSGFTSFMTCSLMSSISVQFLFQQIWILLPCARMLQGAGAAEVSKIDMVPAPSQLAIVGQRRHIKSVIMSRMNIWAREVFSTVGAQTRAPLASGDQGQPWMRGISQEAIWWLILSCQRTK